MEIESCSRSIICFQGSNGRVGRCHCLCSWRHGFLTQLWSQRARFLVLNSSRWLGCKDAAKWPPHSCPTRRCARDATACASNRIQLVVVVVVVFFFSFLDLLRLTPIRLRHVPIRAELGRFRLNRPNINVFQLEKGNRLVRKKKKNLNLKYRWTRLDIDTPLSPVD